MRRPLVWVAAIVLFVEAIGIALLNWFLGMVVDRQDMSMAGLDSDMMARSSKIGGLVFGLYFLACAVSALLVALRQRPPGLVGRVLLVSAAVVHALLGAFTVGLVGWGAFTFMMVVLALIVFTLLAYDGRETGPVDAAPEAGGTGDGEGDAAEAGSAGVGEGVAAGSVDLGKGAEAKGAGATSAEVTSTEATSAEVTSAEVTSAEVTSAEVTGEDAVAEEGAVAASASSAS